MDQKLASVLVPEKMSWATATWSINQELPPQLRLSATSNGEQRVRVRVPNAQGLHRTTQFLMQECLNLVDWKGLELPGADNVKLF